MGMPVVPLVNSNVPPDETVTVPPVTIAAPMAAPPLNTVSAPPLETVVLLAVPPASTICEPEKTVTPLATPKTSCLPPEICAPSSVPRALTISLPPLDTVVPLAVPLEKTISLPPLATTALLTDPPDRISNCDPDETTVPPESTPPAKTFSVMSLLTDSPL